MVSQVTHKDKLKKLQSIMIRYAEQKKQPLPNGSGHILPDGWSEDFKWVLARSGELQSNPKLSAQDKRQANQLYRDYLGWV